MLCICCHKKLATVHITTTNQDGSRESQDLCEDCAEQPSGAPGLKAWTDTIENRQCEFCGAPATGGSSSPGGQRFWCYRCAQQFGRILQEVYDESAKPADPKDLPRWVQSAMDEAGRRMIRRSSDGGTAG
jgi:hypothetical protein